MNNPNPKWAWSPTAKGRHFETTRRRELRRRAEEKHNNDRAAQAAAQLRELRLVASECGNPREKCGLGPA